MIGKIAFVCLSLFAIALAVDVSSRPKNCAVGTTYKKDCNTCTCAAAEKDDKCGQVDCNRGSGSTGEPDSSGKRPGICPTVPTNPPNAKEICAEREKKDPGDKCKVDSDCGQAKKCCPDGCEKKSCRNAIYSYNTR